MGTAMTVTDDWSEEPVTETDGPVTPVTVRFGHRFFSGFYNWT
jgi:hypothetical protein